MALISKIHLGSEEVPDVLGRSGRAECKTVGSLSENIISEAEFILLDDHNTLDFTPLSDFGNSETPRAAKGITVEQPLAGSENSSASCLTQSTTESQTQAQGKKNEAAIRNEDAIEQPSAACGNSTERAEPQTSRANLASSSTPRTKRYTSSLIQCAAESYNQAQDKRYEAAIRNAEAIGSLSAALLEYSAVCRERNEVEKVKAEAEIIKANALLMQAKTEQIKLKLAVEDFIQ